MNEVVAELDRSDFEDSEDDLDGYLDMKCDDEAYTNKRRDFRVSSYLLCILPMVLLLSSASTSFALHALQY